jgi:hypothetical protein
VAIKPEKTKNAKEKKKKKRKRSGRVEPLVSSKGNRGDERTGGKKRQNRGVRRRETEPGKILVHQPAAPRAFTSIVSILDGEDRTEN